MFLLLHAQAAASGHKLEGSVEAMPGSAPLALACACLIDPLSPSNHTCVCASVCLCVCVAQENGLSPMFLSSFRTDEAAAATAFE